MDAPTDVTLHLHARRTNAPPRAPEEAAREHAARLLRRGGAGVGAGAGARAWLLDSVGTLHELDLSPLPDGGMSLLLDALEQVFARVRARRVALLLPSKDGGEAPLALLASDGFETSVSAFGLRGRTVVAVSPPPLETERFEELVRGDALIS